MWELEFLQWLDEQPDVVEVMYEKLYITYISNKRSGRTRRYYPDFVVTWADGRREILEVKPKRRVAGRTVQKKAAAATAWAAQNGATYRFVTEVDLRALGLLRSR